MPWKLRAYLLSEFVPIFAIGLSFFVVLLGLFDLLANIVGYLQAELPTAAILRLLALGMPKNLSYALPVALLFSASYAFGSLAARNELIPVFGSGTSLASFAAPLLAVALALSAFGFWFEDAVVIPSVAAKDAASRAALGRTVTRSRSQATIMTDGGRRVWDVEFYDDASKTLSGVRVITRDEAGRFSSRVDAQRGVWDGASWVFTNARRYWIDAATGDPVDRFHATYSDPELVEPPESFRARADSVDGMRNLELAAYVEFLKRTGLPYGGELAARYERIAFALAPFVVVLMAVPLGGRLGKNSLLASLFTSLVAATGYYIARMVSMLLAKGGSIPPELGAFAPLAIFVLAGAFLTARAKS